MQAARQAAEELGAELTVIKKTSVEYGREDNPPPCPSMAVNGHFIVFDGTVTYEDLKQAIGKNG